MAAIALPQLDKSEQTEAELGAWREQKQIQLFNDLPYPVLFGSADDLTWLTETNNGSPSGAGTPNQAGVLTIKKRKAKKSRKRQKEFACGLRG